MINKYNELEKPINNAKENAQLGKLWRRIIMDLNLRTRIRKMVNEYVRDSKNPNVNPINYKTKSSLENNILSDEITWKTFMDLLFNFLKVRSCTVTITLEHRNGDESAHSIHVVNGELVNERKKDDEKQKWYSGR